MRSRLVGDRWSERLLDGCFLLDMVVEARQDAIVGEDVLLARWNYDERNGLMGDS